MFQKALADDDTVVWEWWAPGCSIVCLCLVMTVSSEVDIGAMSLRVNVFVSWDSTETYIYLSVESAVKMCLFRSVCFHITKHM